MPRSDVPRLARWLRWLSNRLDDVAWRVEKRWADDVLQSSGLFSDKEANE